MHTVPYENLNPICKIYVVNVNCVIINNNFFKGIGKRLRSCLVFSVRRFSSNVVLRLGLCCTGQTFHDIEKRQQNLFSKTGKEQET